MCGISPEEVYAATVCSGSSVKPCDWLKSELPHLLDDICAIAASIHLSCPTGADESSSVAERRDNEERPQQSCTSAVARESIKLSRAEAKVAWLAAGGDAERAVRQLLRDRRNKVRTKMLKISFKTFVNLLPIEKISFAHSDLCWRLWVIKTFKFIVWNVKDVLSHSCNSFSLMMLFLILFCQLMDFRSS